MNNTLMQVGPVWGIIIVFIAGVIYTLTHRAAAIAYAKRRAHTLMLAAEKQAEQLVLTNGVAKMQWVVDKGYDLLPVPVRVVVSKPLFKMIVQQLFDAAVAFAKAHQVVDTTQVVEPPQTV